MSIVENSTNTPMRSIAYEFNKPIASSDLNEEQSIILNNLIEYVNGNVENNSFKLSINSFSNSSTGITVTGIKYLINDTNYMYCGYITPSMILTVPSTPSVDDIFDVYAYYRLQTFTSSSTIYANGIRTNASQSSIVETTTTNNIADISSRKAVEFTFVVVAHEGTAPTLSNWSTGVLVSTLTYKDVATFELTNVNYASVIDQLLNSEQTLVAGTGINITGDEISIKELQSGDMDDIVDPLPSGTSGGGNFNGVRYHASLVDYPGVPCWEDLTDEERAEFNQIDGVMVNFLDEDLPDDIIGDTDISDIGDGTLTGATASQQTEINNLKSDLTSVNSALTKVENVTVYAQNSQNIAITLYKKNGQIYCYQSWQSLLPNNVDTVSFNDVPIGFRPATPYAIIPYYSSGAPYNQIGSLWIRSDGDTVLYKPSTAVSGYINGQYVKGS